MNVRVLNTTTQVLGNVVHARSEFNPYATKCRVRGEWTLVETTDTISCATCLRRVRR